jgi:hypothetical protein
MVLQGEGGAEERHNPVAHHLVDSAFVVMDGFHHPLKDRVEQLPGFLRVAGRQQLHGALEVGEQHRDVLALAFERGLRVDDPFGEVLRRVALGRGEALGGARGSDRRRALEAELRPRRAAASRSSCIEGPAAPRTPGTTSPGAGSPAGTGDTSCALPTRRARLRSGDDSVVAWVGQ